MLKNTMFKISIIIISLFILIFEGTILSSDVNVDGELLSTPESEEGFEYEGKGVRLMPYEGITSGPVLTYPVFRIESNTAS